jgi:hypothetical protein
MVLEILSGNIFERVTAESFLLAENAIEEIPGEI